MRNNVNRTTGATCDMIQQNRRNKATANVSIWFVLRQIFMYSTAINALSYPYHRVHQKRDIIKGSRDLYQFRGRHSTVDAIHVSRGTCTSLQSTTRNTHNLVDFMDSIAAILRKSKDGNDDKTLQKNRRERKDLLLSLVQKAPNDPSSNVLPWSDEIDQAIDSLAELSPITSIDELVKQLDRKWYLVWTTEKEINLFLEKGWSNDITQQISNSNSSIVNTIPFINDNGYFGVTGRIFRTSDDPMIRTQFVFETATLQLNRFSWLPTLTFPPVGKGWFDTVYLDSNFRVDRNSRNDILICQTFE